MSVWKALTGRISLFPSSPSSAPLPSALELYKRVWGADPENFQSSPNALVPTVAQGRRDGLTVGCSVHPTRVDLNLTPPLGTRESGDMTLVLIEDTVQLHTELARLVNFVGDRRGIGADAVSRVGLNLHFITLMPNIEETNKTLISVMPEQYRTRIKDEEDFIFQINRPRASRQVEGIRVNYIAKWSMDRFQLFNISIQANLPVIDARGIPSQKGQGFTAASVVFDNNNVPVTFSLGPQQQSSLLLECLSEAEKLQREIGLQIEGF